jgi:class 3 adenylate cyclase
MQRRRRSIARWTRSGRERFARARLLSAFVEISLGAGNIEAARTAAEEFVSVADTYDAPALHAAAHVARGAVLLAEGNAKEAARTLRRAVTHWHDVEAPYEAARARALLAQAIMAQGDDESAGLELQAARSAFESLGAVPDMNRVDDLLTRLTSGGSPADLERSVRTFLFTDIVRSTNLVEAIGDEAWLDLLRWHDQTLRSLFAEHGGEEVDHAGDGFFVVFDDPASAIACAVAIQQMLAEHRRGHGFAPTVRIGVHAAAATRSGKQFRGKAVHEAARIASLAEGGEILASVSSVGSSSESLTVSETRVVRLKGISNPVEVVAIDWR